MLKDRLDLDVAEPVTNVADAEGYIAKVCFKTGPPERVGVELEWIVHRSGDPFQPLDPNAIADALGDHAPAALWPGSPHTRLPRGGTVTIEPGGQVEISTPASGSLLRLINETTADIAHLGRLLNAAGLRMGETAFDALRAPRRLLNTRRYQAMEAAFDRIGPYGRMMMCSTAGLQVCLDVGTPERAAVRWNALHTLAPALIALFANSPAYGHASHRMAIWYGTDPVRTKPPARSDDPVSAWARRVLDTPLLCLRTARDSWGAPAGVTFADWIDGAIQPAPTYDDLNYHLSTVFAPVRARGYLEVRYLDNQPGPDWILPTAMLAAIFADESTVDTAAAIASPAAGRWESAARWGMSDPVISSVIPELVSLACGALHRTDLPPSIIAEVSHGLTRKGEAARDA